MDYSRQTSRLFSRRQLWLTFGAALGAALAASPQDAARADHAPAYVIPAMPGVPVVIAFQDASYAVVEGDWGLYRPGAVQPVVIRRWDDGGESHGRNRYFPSNGHRPGYGRLEVDPPANRRRPRPAQSYYRSWQAGSGPAPATSPDTTMPMEPPQVILAPREGNDHLRRPRRRTP